MGAVYAEEKPGDHHAGMTAGQLNQLIGKIHQRRLDIALPETNIARGMLVSGRVCIIFRPFFGDSIVMIIARAHLPESFPACPVKNVLCRHLKKGSANG